MVAFYLIIWIATYFVPYAVCITCETGWTRYGVSCYKYFSDKRPWGQARADCLSLGADLVVVKDWDENNFLYTCLITGDIPVWLGLNDIDAEGVWFWVDSGECSSYTNYYINEPNNYENEDCVELNHNLHEETWNDLNCSEEVGYVCEMFEDLEIPTCGLTCPNDVNVVVPLGDTSAAVTWKPPLWTDNECVVTVLESHAPGYVLTIPDGYISSFIYVTYTAYDRAGNPSETCVFVATASYQSDVSKISTMLATTVTEIGQTTEEHVSNSKYSHQDKSIEWNLILGSGLGICTLIIFILVIVIVQYRKQNERHTHAPRFTIAEYITVLLKETNPFIRQTYTQDRLHKLNLITRLREWSCFGREKEILQYWQEFNNKDFVFAGTRSTVTVTNEGVSNQDRYDDVRLSVVEREVRRINELYSNFER